MTAAIGDAVLATDGLSKDYGTVRVVSNFTLPFRAGSIHAILGENGAGKSTLIKMLSGTVTPTHGDIIIGGAIYRPRSVREAQELGIVALPQELSLVPTLGAGENIFLGMRKSGHRVLSKQRILDREARIHLSHLGQHIPLDVPVGDLSAVQQTMVALVRALVRDATVLILDEPTAALTDTETAQLFEVLRALRDRGTAIVYVSHRLEEVFALADTITVMRSGEHVWTKPTAHTDTEDVITAMIGREQGQIFPARSEHPGHELLEVRDIAGHTLNGVSLSARSGSVLGVAGLAGAGRSELLKLISGAERTQRGSILFDGRDVTRRSLVRRMDAGIVLVPEERRSQGLVVTDSVSDNIALANLRALSGLGIWNERRARDTAERGIEDLQIKVLSPDQPVDELSGGNQQKVVLAKYLERKPKLLLLDEPTRGIDIGTKAEIYYLIRRLADEGVAVIMVSSEIPELIGVADDIAVLHEGRLIDTVPAERADERLILHLCYGNPEPPPDPEPGPVPTTEIPIQDDPDDAQDLGDAPDPTRTPPPSTDQHSSRNPA
ncbi:sugar ABC transporter ATP-binding protein [Leucobacter sp. GX24907]